MNTIQPRRVVVGADFAGHELKEAVKAHLEERGWEVDDLTPVKAEAPMYHRVGFLLGSKLSEKEYDKALAFCGSGMGIHVAASKCPHVHAAVAETVSSARRAATANNCNLLAMGAFFVGPQVGMAMADAFLDHSLGDGYEDWDGFYDYHRLGYEESEHFDYAAFKASGFALASLTTPHLGTQPTGLAF